MMRRPFGVDREFGDDMDIDEGGGLFGGPAGTTIENLFGMTGQSPMFDAPAAGDGQPSPEMDMRGDMGLEPGAMKGEDSPGSIDRARELFRTPRPPTYGNLPEGVTVPQTQFEGVPQSSNTMQTSLSPMTPSPVAGSGQAASYAPAEGGGTGQGPQRPAFTPAASALFGESPRSSGLFGALGGLDEGGIGAVGTNNGGPAPTEMMLALLRQLRGEQGVM